MSRFERAVALILEIEGEWSDHPDDTGLRTRWGISSRAYPDLDLSTLTRKQAIAIYRRDYWAKARCEKLPAPLGLAIFDAAVHSGPVAAVRSLQRVLGVRVDGALGPLTIAAVEAREPIVLRLVLEQRARDLIELSERPGQGVFRLGWMRRLVRVALECGRETESVP